jgi:hypothetical protein
LEFNISFGRILEFNASALDVFWSSTLTLDVFWSSTLQLWAFFGVQRFSFGKHCLVKRSFFMMTAQLSLNESLMQFLEQYQLYGFKDKNELICTALLDSLKYVA